MSQDFESQMTANIKKPFFVIQLDESTAITGKAQLIAGLIVMETSLNKF
jgi:hypothetical protein